VKRLALVICIAACVALPASAAAKNHPRYLTPPGNSGITQYSEVVPSAGGNTPTSGHPAAPPSQAPPAARHALAGSGKSRQELLGFVASTAPPAAAKHSSKHGGSGSSPGRHAVSAASAANPSGSSGLASFVKSLAGSGGGSGGMGLILPLILGATLLGAVGAWARRRTRF
jgi:hypothetical protein